MKRFDILKRYRISGVLAVFVRLGRILALGTESAFLSLFVPGVSF